MNAFSTSHIEEERQKAMMVDLVMALWHKLRYHKVHLVPLRGSDGRCPEIERILTRDKPDILIGKGSS